MHIIIMLSTGIDGKIRFVLTEVTTESDFIQCNITYDECKDYPIFCIQLHSNGVDGGSESTVR